MDAEMMVKEQVSTRILAGLYFWERRYCYRPQHATSQFCIDGSIAIHDASEW